MESDDDRVYVNTRLDAILGLVTLILSSKGGRVGDPEIGAGQIFQQVRRNLQRREQAQTLHSHRPDRLPSSNFPGEIRLY